MHTEHLYHNISDPAHSGAVSLHWPNKRTLKKAKHVSARTLERYGQETHRLYWGNNRDALSHLLTEHRGSVDLIYVDPPFDSKANYDRIIRLRGHKSEHQARQTQYGDQWLLPQYLQFMYERLLLMRELLSDTGSLYLHADWHRIHHLRLLLDDVFGPERLLNEIIWHHDFGGRSPYFLARKHDNLLLYRKGDAWTFNLDALPELPYQGHLHKYRGATKKAKKPTAVWHDVESEHDFVWDIAYENKMATQNTGYPTQKPLALLERIIRLSSRAGDTVLDPFLGSGTTAVVATRLDRHFIGIDDNWDAIHTTRTRLANEGPLNLSIHTTNSFAVFKNPWLAKQRYPALLRPNNSIDVDDLQDLDLNAPPTSILGHHFTPEAQHWLTKQLPTTCLKILETVPEERKIQWHREDQCLIIDNIDVSSIVKLLSISQEAQNALHWRSFTQSVTIDFHHSTPTLQDPFLDSPLHKNHLVAGRYSIPPTAGDTQIVITDVLGQEHRIKISKAQLWND